MGSVGSSGRAAYRSGYHGRDYLERTIETVRQHQHADNCWPQWANIFADEIERLWKIEEAAVRYFAGDESAFYDLRPTWAIGEEAKGA